MIQTASEIRSAARAALRGHWGEAAMLSFVYSLICGLFSATTSAAFDLITPGLGTLTTILLYPMGWSFAIMFLMNSRGEEDPFAIGHLFDGYKDFKRITLTALLQTIYILLWTLLLIIPGIIKSMSYGMTYFILKDHPELQYNSAIELSMKMMDGHKWELFWLYLTFIGWGILCIFTLCIGFFWLNAYMSASLAQFYEQVKEEYAQKQL